MITNSSFSGACTSAGSSCNICANESVTLSASEVNLPNGACIEWYYSSDPGFNPYNGNGTYIGCGSINAGSVSNVIFETTQDMCNGTYYVIGIINPADLQGCPGSYTNIFTFNVICPIATIGFLTPICSGFLGLTSSGGESYQWEGPGGFSSNLQNPILEFTDPAQGGLYYVTVTAANGCKTVKSVDVPPEVQMFVHIDPPYTDYIELCGGGSVTLTLIDYGGGTGSYINQGWYDNSGNFLSGAQSITVSAAGEYTYWVFDAIYGCGVGAFLDVHALDSLNISIDPHPIHLCPGGTIDISASSSNGLSPFEYLWSTGSSSSSININSIGSYVVTMTDAKGCSGTKQIDVPAGNPLTVSISPLSDVYCPGKNNYLTGKASGGLEPYEYDWVTPGGTASTAQINANMVGNYTVIITDKVGCSGTASINVKQNPDIVIDITPASPIICNNGTIKLNATASGGSGSGYQYKWTAPSGLTYTGKTITSIEAGVFKVIVTDSEGCTNEQKTTVTLVSELNVEIDPSPAEFCPGGFVVLDAYVVGGTGTYTFDWDTPSGSFTGNNIKADLLGVYYVTITDINGCTGKSEKEVKSKTEIQVSISPDSFSICKGDTIVLKASSTEPGILIYKWTGPEGAYTGDSIIVSSAGNYSVTVTDSGGCSGKSATVVKLNQNPGISISPVPALICEGDSLQLKVSSQDTNIITYNWQTLTGLKSGNTIYAKIASIYVVEVVNSLGCRAFDTIQTSLAPAITVDISPDPASFCAGNSIEITTSTSDTGIISYNWSTPQGILNTQSISAGIAGQYIATLINSFGCVGSDTINVVQNDTLPVSIVPVPASFCPGHNIKLTASTTAGGLINYNWSTPNGAQTGNEIIADVSGNYTVNITNSSGCSGTTSVNVTESQGLIEMQVFVQVVASI